MSMLEFDGMRFFFINRAPKVWSRIRGKFDVPLPYHAFVANTAL